MRTYIGYVKPSKIPGVKVLRFWSAYKKILTQLGNIDLVHLHRIFPLGIFALHLQWSRKIKFLITEHWTGFHPENRHKISWFEKWISKRITKKATFVCPVSANLEQSMTSFGLQGNYRCVPNVVDTKLFVPKTKKKTHLRITHISDLNDAHKNVSGMLQVASKLSKNGMDYTWQFVGGNKEPFLPLLKQLNLTDETVVFRQHIPHHKIPQILNDSDVFVLFSNYENLPCVVLESFACGTPVIATDVGGISEYFPEKFGVLIQVSNQAALEKQLIHFDRNIFAEGTQMHRYAKNHFGPEIICKSFSNLYLKSLN